MSSTSSPLFSENGVPFSAFFVKVVCLAVGLFLIWKRTTKRRYNLPPGPRNYPFLGCMPSLDHKSPISTFTMWAKQYGKFYHCKLGKDNILVVNDAVLLKALFSNDNCVNRPSNPGATFRKAESGGHCGTVHVINQSIDWLIDWMDWVAHVIGLLIDCVVRWLIDWLIVDWHFVFRRVDIFGRRGMERASAIRLEIPQRFRRWTSIHGRKSGRRSWIFTLNVPQDRWSAFWQQIVHQRCRG